MPALPPRLQSVVLGGAVAAGTIGLSLAAHPRAMEVAGFWAWVPPVSALFAGVWVAAAVVERRIGRTLPAVTAILVGLAIGATALGAGLYLKRSLAGESVRAWSVFHYHTTSRWFPQMGYDGLYAAVLAADDRWQDQKARMSAEEFARADAIPDFRAIRRARDLHTYEIVPRGVAVADLDRAVWTDADLDQLGRETRALVPFLDADSWATAFTDLGFKPAPPWLLVGRVLAARPAEGLWLRLVANVDVPVLALLTVALWWGFGPRTTAAAWLFLATVPFNDGRLFGNMLQYDWLLAMVGAIAAYRRGWPATAGALLAWAAGTRVFPGILLVPPAIELAWAAVRRRPLPEAPARLVGAAVVALALLVLASGATGRGFHAWREWRQTIAVHEHTHPVTGEKRIGLGRLAVWDPSTAELWGVRRGRTSVLADEVADRALPFRVVGALVVLAAIARTRRDTDRVLLTLLAVWVLTVSSRYYASAWILLLALGRPPRGRADDGPQDAVGVGLAAGLLLLPAVMEYGDPPPVAAYFLANLYVGALFVGASLARAAAGDRG